MPRLDSAIDTRSAPFRANAAAMQALLDDLRQQTAQVAEGGGARSRDRHVARGKLLPRDRVQMLIDPGLAVPGAVAAGRARACMAARARAAA